MMQLFLKVILGHAHLEVCSNKNPPVGSSASLFVPFVSF